MWYRRKPKQAPTARRPSAGFTIIELLLALVILGILAAIVIPNMLNALDKARQKRTMADIRSLSSAVETYSVDNGYYPNGGDIAALAILVPEYSRKPIETDAWNHPLIYAGNPLLYSLGSTGKDGGSVLTLTDGGGATHDFDDDIIFAIGQFVQWPEGTQE